MLSEEEVLRIRILGNLYRLHRKGSVCAEPYLVSLLDSSLVKVQPVLSWLEERSFAVSFTDRHKYWTILPKGIQLIEGSEVEDDRSLPSTPGEPADGHAQ